MKMKQPARIKTNADGMEVIDYCAPEYPIAFFLDEIEKYDRGYIRWHWHSFIQFVVARDNPVELYIEDKKTVLHKDEGAFINTNRMHMIKCADGVSAASLYTVIVSPEFIAPKNSLIYRKHVRPLIDDPALSNIPFLSGVEWQQQACHIIKSAFLANEEKAEGHELVAHSLLCSIWLSVIHNQDSLPKQKPSRAALHSQKRIKEMLAYIQSNYAQSISLAHIARHANVSKSECIRCFKKTLGITPMQYLTDYRLEVAAGLLAASADSIKNIAYRCGFDDASYFNKLFRRAKSMTPTQYRRAEACASPKK